jgi:rod shape determining protein RodA
VAVQLIERRVRAPADPRRRGLLYTLRHLDLALFGATLALAAIGLVVVYSATKSSSSPTYFVEHQAIYVVFGVVAMLVVTVIDYRRLAESWGYLFYGLAIVSLLGVRAIGTAALGAQREVNLGLISLQPSEFAVLALIVAVAVFVHTHEEDLGARRFVKLLLLAGVPMLLVLIQPDLGTTTITAVVLLAMLVLAGVRLRYLALLVLGAVAITFLAVHLHVLPSYQLQRFLTFIHQDNPTFCSSPSSPCYQLIESKTAIGAGGMRGTGLFAGALTNTGFVPYAYADFIFSAIGEQLGFVGAAVVLGLFGVLALRIFRATQRARDTLGRLVCVGVLAFVVYSVFQNVGMSVGLMPITGVPLPFISYGGSAILAFFIAIGLVASVELHQGGRR